MAQDVDRGAADPTDLTELQAKRLTQALLQGADGEGRTWAEQENEAYADEIEESLEIKSLATRLRDQGVDLGYFQIQRASDAGSWDDVGDIECLANFLYVEYERTDREFDWNDWCEMIAGRALLHLLLGSQNRPLSTRQVMSHHVNSVGVPGGMQVLRSLCTQPGEELFLPDIEDAARFVHSGLAEEAHPFMFNLFLQAHVPGARWAVQALLHHYCRRVRAAWKRAGVEPLSPLPDEEDWKAATTAEYQLAEAVAAFVETGKFVEVCKRFKIGQARMRRELLAQGISISRGRPTV